jgi:hypothetical protein
LRAEADPQDGSALLDAFLQQLELLGQERELARIAVGDAHSTPQDHQDVVCPEVARERLTRIHVVNLRLKASCLQHLQQATGAFEGSVLYDGGSVHGRLMIAKPRAASTRFVVARSARVA